MALPVIYTSGTVSVTNGETTVTGSSTLWGDDAIMAGDLFCDPAQPLVPPQRIASVTDDGELELAVGWPGTTITDDAYEIRFVGIIERSTAQTRRLLEQLSVVRANGQGRFFRFSDTTTDADPGAGYIRLNNADPTLATAAYIDVLDANGASVAGELDSWGDSTSLAKGKLWLSSITAPSTFRAYAVTGSVVDGTGYRKLTLTHIGGSGSFAADDELMVAFARTGDAGDGYITDATVADPSELTALEGEAAGYLVFVTDLQTDFGAYSGRSGVVELIAGPDWQVVALYTGPKGATGATGATGDTGATGATGAPGGGLKGIACRVVATSNVTISTDLEAGDTIDGVALSGGDLVLLTAQTAPEENGVYIASVSGSASRHPDFDAWADFPGSYFPVNEGTLNADTLWRCTSNSGGTIGSSALSFEEFSAGSVAVIPSVRLSLAAGVAVTESDIVGATTVHIVPVGHIATAIYNGTGDAVWLRDALSVALDATDHPAAKNYDVFEAVVAGAVIVGTGPEWGAGAVAGSDTSRGTGSGSTEVELFHGRMVNKNSITLRATGGAEHVVPARQANLLGSFRTVGAGETEDSKLRRFVSSAYMPAQRAMERAEATDNWNYSTGAWRQANGSADNKVSFINSLGGGIAEACVNCIVSTSGGVVFPSVGVGVDSSTSNVAILLSQATSTTVSGVGVAAFYKGAPGVGYHEIRWLEYGGGADTQTWYGDAGGAPNFRSGLVASVVN
jgi:hypothetical protein